jgi:hypothetical protein
MGVGYVSPEDVPMGVIIRDLEYEEIDSDMRKSKQPKPETL